MIFSRRWNRKLKPTFVTLICIGVLILLRNLAYDNNVYRSVSLQQKREYQMFSSFYRREKMRGPFRHNAIRLNELGLSSSQNTSDLSDNIVCRHPKLDLVSDSNKEAFYDVGSIQCFGRELFSMEEGILKMNKSLLLGDRIKRCSYQAIERIDDNYATYATAISGTDSPFDVIIQHDFVRVQCYFESKKSTSDSRRNLLSLSSRPNKYIDSKAKKRIHRAVLPSNKLKKYENTVKLVLRSVNSENISTGRVSRNITHVEKSIKDRSTKNIQNIKTSSQNGLKREYNKKLVLHPKVADIDSPPRQNLKAKFLKQPINELDSKLGSQRQQIVKFRKTIKGNAFDVLSQQKIRLKKYFPDFLTVNKTRSRQVFNGIDGKTSQPMPSKGLQKSAKNSISLKSNSPSLKEPKSRMRGFQYVLNYSNSNTGFSQGKKNSYLAKVPVQHFKDNDFKKMFNSKTMPKTLTSAGHKQVIQSKMFQLNELKKTFSPVKKQSNGRKTSQQSKQSLDFSQQHKYSKGIHIPQYRNRLGKTINFRRSETLRLDKPPLLTKINTGKSTTKQKQIETQHVAKERGVMPFLNISANVKTKMKTYGGFWQTNAWTNVKLKQKYLRFKKKPTNYILPINASRTVKPKSPANKIIPKHQPTPKNVDSQVPQMMLVPTFSKLNSLIYTNSQKSANPIKKNSQILKQDKTSIRFLNIPKTKSKVLLHKKIQKHPASKSSTVTMESLDTYTNKDNNKLETARNSDSVDMADPFLYDNSKEAYINLPPEDYGINDELPDIEQFFVQIYPKLEVFKRITEIPQFIRLNTIPLNILIYGLDSLSHLSFQRKLPLSYKYLKDSLNAVIMNGYNIVGDATTAAIIPLLTGSTETELPEVRKNQLASGFVDDYPLIWNKYRSKGYATLFAEDCPSLAVFNLRFNGFYSAPTDHYMRPFWQAVSESVLNERSLNFCLGSKPKHQFTLDYVMDFFQKYNNVSKFAFAFHGELSHNDNNPVQYLDKDFVHFLQSMEHQSLLNNTLLIVMSDHGARYSNVRNTVQGKLEERLPFMSFVFPKWFQDKYPYFMKNFRGNQEKLVTPFDVHETMLDLLDSSRMFEPVDFSTRGVSLLQPIPHNRTCKSAGIAMHWCSCLTRFIVDPSTPLVRLSLQKIMSYIRTLLLPVRHTCAELSIKKIFHAYLVSPNEKVLKFTNSKDADNRVANFSQQMLLDTVHYQLTFETYPNSALYEASVQVDIRTQNFQVFPEISRLNKYGEQPHCIKDKFPDLRKYCYCKNG